MALVIAAIATQPVAHRAIAMAVACRVIREEATRVAVCMSCRRARRTRRTNIPGRSVAPRALDLAAAAGRVLPMVPQGGPRLRGHLRRVVVPERGPDSLLAVLRQPHPELCHDRRYPLYFENFKNRADLACLNRAGKIP